MSFSIRKRIIGAVVAVLSAQSVWAFDMRFDVATYDQTNYNLSYFSDAQLATLNFPSVNGHMINMGSDAHQATLNAQGNTLGIYYNQFNTLTGGTPLYSADPNPHDAAETIQSWINQHFGSANQGDWLVLNEISSSLWNSSTAYQSWVVNVIAQLKNGDNSDPANPIPAHQGVIIYAPFANPAGAARANWQLITQNAYIGDECYVNGQTVATDNYSVSTIQQIYQTSFNSWTTNAGVPASRLILGEEFTASQAGNGYGADGLSGSNWQAAIEVRDLAIHNIPFGGFIGYAWDKFAQATGNPSIDAGIQESYEAAYDSTLVTQTEIPAWTGIDGSTSWNDYLNWTGGLPSTISAPYPLLASDDPNLPKQTTANFLTAIQANTTITLDGNQSITTLSFGSPYSYTIAPGSSGVLTMSGANSSISVTQGSHFITAGLQLANNVTVNLNGNLTLSGSLITQGNTLTETGNGTLTISGAQSHTSGSAIAVNGGVLDLNSDACSTSAANLALSASNAGSVVINSPQHLASLTLSGTAGVTDAEQGEFIYAHSLSIGSTATLNLGENDLIDDYTGATPLNAIQAEIRSGYNKGNWNGAGIITTAAASHPGTALGLAEASDVLGIGATGSGTFDGQTVDGSTLLIKFTWLGDANLDGVVNEADLARMSTTGTTWAQGDFNYDGVVNADDYALFALGAAYGQGNISAILPEPALITMSLALMWSLKRPRRK